MILAILGLLAMKIMAILGLLAMKISLAIISKPCQYSTRFSWMRNVIRVIWLVTSLSIYDPRYKPRRRCCNPVSVVRNPEFVGKESAKVDFV